VIPWWLAVALAADPVPAEAPVAPSPGSDVAAAGDDAVLAELRAVRAELEAQRAELTKLRARGVDTGARDGIVAGPGDGDVTVAPGEETRDVVALGRPVVVFGVVQGDATAIGADILVKNGGVVRGDAVSVGGRVRVEPGGVVEGDRVGVGGAVGPAVFTAPDLHHLGRPGLGRWFSDLAHRLVAFLSFAGAGVVVVGLFPNRVGRVAHRIQKAPGTSLFVGSVATGGILFAALLFLVTVIGLPITFVLVALLGLAWLLGFVGLCQAIGDRLPVEHKVHGRWLAFLGGTLLVAFLGSLPVVGMLAVIVASAVGVGAALTTRFGAA
jgi:hypothetical protein